MKKQFQIPTVFLLFVSFIVFTAATSLINSPADDFTYVGVKKCKTCHKGDSKGNQLEIWEASAHANAYKTLETPEADAIATEKNFETPAAETPECVKCHVLGKDIDPAALEDSFDKTEGVQCETCHGPGSGYKKLSIMKDREKAVENGLLVYDDVGTFCKSCHNSESPTFESFNFEERWEQIKHPIPSE
jgi:hypothetical protein